MVEFGLVSLLNGISLCSKTILVEEQDWYYLSRRYGGQGVYTFPKGISSKMNISAQLEFELAFYDVTVQYVSHYTTGTSPNLKKYFQILYYSNSDNELKTHLTDWEGSYVNSS